MCTVLVYLYICICIYVVVCHGYYAPLCVPCAPGQLVAKQADPDSDFVIQMIVKYFSSFTANDKIQGRCFPLWCLTSSAILAKKAYLREET